MHWVLLLIAGGLALATGRGIMNCVNKQFDKAEEFASEQESDYISVLTPEEAIKFWIKREVTALAVSFYLLFRFAIAPISGLSSSPTEWGKAGMEGILLLCWFPTFWYMSQYITGDTNLRRVMAWGFYSAGVIGFSTGAGWATMGLLLVVTYGVPLMLVITSKGPR